MRAKTTASFFPLEREKKEEVHNVVVRLPIKRRTKTEKKREEKVPGKRSST